MAAGDIPGARSLVEQWWSGQPPTRPGEERARALYLRARLAEDGRSAEEDYLALVLGYPMSSLAPESLLRLGQLLLSAGEHARSEGYLQRLVNDYPGHPLHGDGFYWLARARRAAGKTSAACQAARSGLRTGVDAELYALLGAEAAGCPEREAPRSAPVAPGDYSVQMGAYRSAGNASALLRHLRSRGLDPRLVTIPGSDLVRLRVGRFTDSREAAVLRARLVTQGFEAVVVDDVARETPVSR